MDRRRFLSMLSAAGAVGWSLTATGSWARPLEGVFGRPVPFVDTAAVGDQGDLFDIDGAATANHQARRYPQSVAAGDPKAQGVVLWTRVIDDDAEPAPVAWQISRDRSFTDVVLAGAARLDPAADHTVKLAVAHPALRGFSTYYYRFIHRGVASRTGRFKTLPAERQTITRLRLGYITCQDYGFGFYNALARLAEEDVDYVVHLGDYIYETVDAGFQQGAARQLAPLPSGQTVPADLEDYRHLYRSYRQDADLQRLHERFAMIVIWDDHEFGNDCHGDIHPDNNTGDTTATTPQPALRQAANRAWSEHIPADTAFDARRPWDESIQIYRRFRFGQLAELIATDERLYRDGPPCGTDTAGERYATFGCAARHDPVRTMLGRTQRDWFIDTVTASPARWKLWANEVMLMQLKVGPVFANLDQWDGYPAERAHILSTLRDAGTTNVVALTGDLHTFTAGYLKPDYDNLLEWPMGVELMVGSVTSANLEDQIRSGLNLPSAPMPAERLGVPANKLAPAVRLANPHIHYWNSAVHGYAVLDLDDTALTCRYMAVDTISAPDAGVRPLKTMRVPSGRVWIEDIE